MRKVAEFPFWCLIAFLSCVALNKTVCPVAWASVPQGEQWKRYTVKDEEFSVTLPTLPAMRSRQIRKLNEPATHWERTIGAYADGVVYVIYTFENRSHQPLEEFIDERRRRAGPRSWDVNTGREISHNGYAGKEYDLRYSGVVGLVQFFSTKNHLYQLEAVGAELTDPRVTRFFSSLVLGPKSAGDKLSDGPGMPVDSASNGAPEVFSAQEVDRKVAIVTKPTPSYTDGARKNRIRGTVVLKALFSDRGVISETQVISGLPEGLTESAIYASKQIKYVPAVKDGKFVSVWLNLEYNFNLY